MDRSLLWGSLAVGLAGWFVAVLLPAPGRSAKPPGSAIPKLYWIVASVLPPLIFLASLPTKPPFSEGHGLGCGFLTGGIAALLAVLAVDRTLQYPTERSPAFAAAAPMFISVSAASVSLLYCWANIIDTLMGLGIAWLSVTTILTAGYLSRSSLNGNPSTRTITPLSTCNPQQALFAGTAFAITLFATAALGVYKGRTAYDHHRWAALGVAVATGVPFLLTFTALPMSFFGRIALKLPLAGMVGGLASRLFQSEDSSRAAAGLARIAIAGALLLGYGKLLSVKLVDQPHIWHVLAVGLGVVILVWWLISQRTDATTSYPSTKPPTQPYLPLLLTTASFMAIYPLLTGFGIGLALMGGWMIASIALTYGRDRTESDNSQGLNDLLSRLLTFGTLILLYRLFSTRFVDDIHGVGLADQYALFGLIAGAALPVYLSGPFDRQSRGDLTLLFRLAICAAILIVAPGFMIVLWGSKCAIAMLFGLALSVGLGVGQSSDRPYFHSLDSLFAIGAGLALTQWLHIAMPLASMTRAHKVQTVAWVVGGIIVIAIVSDFSRKLAIFDSSKAGDSGR